MSFNQIRFKEFITLQRGFDLPKNDRSIGQYPVVASTSIQDYHSEFKVKPPGVVTGRSGSLGAVQYIKRPFWPLNTTLWVKDFKGNDPKFVYYLLKTLGLDQYNSGAGVPTLNRNHLDEIIISIPTVATQRILTSILSTYDDLIENNLRRSKILEKMAQNLYREWFVKFRFPGHENVRFVDSELGRIPEGWEVDTVDNTFTILGGGTPSKKKSEFWDDGSVNWYTPTDLTSSDHMFMIQSSKNITELGLKKSSAKLFPPFSVMMTSRATLGVISINTTEACTNQGFITCIPNERYPLNFLYNWLKENVDYFISLGTGATFKEITKGVFKTIKLIVPEVTVTKKFEKIIEPIVHEILILQRKNQNLRQTRDLLLPKLISGEIDVSELEIAMEEEVTQ